MERIHISSDSPWEKQVGYSRAIRVGQTVHVTGTIGTDATGALRSPGDAYAQTMDAFDIVLDECGSAEPRSAQGPWRHFWMPWLWGRAYTRGGVARA